ncbi:hypothetical protein LCGC14_1441970 [marine sediment metagenome]|uniref:Uncharacterized protein n=1 Tax=marine sediment metagenome TaxID=412755 RepID=A0A0F9JKF1_9ZZZZ
MLSEILSFVAGALTAVLAEPLRRWIFRPTLTLEFKNTEHFVTRSKERSSESTYDSYWVRAKATNSSASLARGCRAFLTDIERLGPSGSWQPTDYCESLQLAWSARDEASFSALDLPHDIPHFIDIVSTRCVTASFLPTLSVKLYRYDALFSTPGTYRFTVLVSGDGVKPATLRIRFEWTGQWDKFTTAMA